MPARPTLAEVLAKGHPGFAVLRRGTAQLSKASRRALAPRIPTQQELRYLKLAAAVQNRVAGMVETLFTGPANALGPARADVVGSDFEDAFAELNAQLLGLFGGKELKGQLQGIGEGIVSHGVKEMERTLAIDLRGTEGGLDPYVQQFVARNVNLIRSVSFDQLPRMREVINNYHAGQTNQRSLRDQLMDTFDLSRARASLIARDQTLKANADITQLQQNRAGVTEYIWTTAGDERVRGRPGGKYPDSQGDHWVLDGTRQNWALPPVVDPTTGRREHPGKDFQCRCVPVPVVDQLLGRATKPTSVQVPQTVAEKPPEPIVPRGGFVPSPVAREDIDKSRAIAAQVFAEKGIPVAQPGEHEEKDRAVDLALEAQGLRKAAMRWNGEGSSECWYQSSVGEKADLGKFLARDATSQELKDTADQLIYLGPAEDVQRLARAQYAATQEAIAQRRAQGQLPEVDSQGYLTLYRGLSGKQSAAIREANPTPGTTLSLPIRSLSSWTTEKSVAKDFAESAATYTGDKGVIVTQRVHVSRVYAQWQHGRFSGNTYNSEREWILAFPEESITLAAENAEIL